MWKDNATFLNPHRAAVCIKKLYMSEGSRWVLFLREGSLFCNKFEEAKAFCSGIVLYSETLNRGCVTMFEALRRGFYSLLSLGLAMCITQRQTFCAQNWYLESSNFCKAQLAACHLNQSWQQQHAHTLHCCLQLNFLRWRENMQMCHHSSARERKVYGGNYKIQASSLFHIDVYYPANTFIWRKNIPYVVQSQLM